MQPKAIVTDFHDWLDNIHYFILGCCASSDALLSEVQAQGNSTSGRPSRTIMYGFLMTGLVIFITIFLICCEKLDALLSEVQV